MGDWMLMRHGKSDWQAGAPDDFSRPLNARGRLDAARMGEWLAEPARRPDRILASPAQRARQTAEFVAQAAGLGPDSIEFHDALYLADRATLLEILQLQPEAAWVLLVAHNPGLDELLCWLSAEPPPRTASGKLMTTAAVAWLRVPAGTPRAGTGVLHGLVRPADLCGENSKPDPKASD